MKKTTIAGTMLAVLLLAGCSAPAADAEVAPKPAVAESSNAPEATPSSEPAAAAITAVPVEPTAELTRAQERGFKDENDWYLRALAGALVTVAVSEDELIGAGMLACDQLRAGTPLADVRVVEGVTSESAQDNSNIVFAASEAYCPGPY